MPDYVTVYQLSSGPSGLPFGLAGLAPLAIGLILILGKWRLGWRRPGWLLAGFSCAFGIMWMFLATGPILTEGTDVFRAFQTGQYAIVEGTVEDFHPMPYEGHDEECFTVGSQRFCYSDYIVTPGFHNAASHGGPIRSGIHVRVAYLGGTILRLEIPRNEVFSPSELTARAESAERQYAVRTDNDPFLQQVNTAFLFATVCWVLWWNLQWRQAMRFWIRPPNKPFVVYLFRMFFALSLIGSVNGFVDQIRRHPITRENAGEILVTAMIICVVVAAMTALSVWFSARRERQVNDKPQL
jgi:hypothetical protein